MQEQRDRLRDRYDFAAWGGKDANAPGVLGLGLRLLGDEIEGWIPHRTQLVLTVGEPPANLSVWRPAEPDGALLAIDIYECASVEAARVFLLRLLAEFQGPELLRVRGPGDAAFARGEAALLFARDNYATLVRSIERVPAPAREIAFVIDRLLTESRSGDQPPAIATLRADGDVAEGLDVPLRVEASDPGGGPVWIRLTTPSGELRLERGSPVFVPSRGGPHEIRVRATGPGGTATAVLRLPEAASR